MKMDSIQIEQTYKELAPLYNRLATTLKPVLESFMISDGIQFFDVEYRVKEFKSLLGKIERKGYETPFDTITDFCGLRIIAYYTSDLDKIITILSNEFDVIEINNKQNELEEDRFGYISYHFIGRLKSSWLGAPNYRGLNSLTFEIQVRTVLMHGWATISHKLSYKHEKDIPRKLRRDLFRLSALIELADEQFERIRKEREEYVKQLVMEQDSNTRMFNYSGELDLDSLEAILNFYFSERSVNEADLSSLLKELQFHEVTLEMLNNHIVETLPYLDDIEKEEAELNEYDGKFPVWGKGGVLRTIMDLRIEDYYTSRKDGFPDGLQEITEKWRKVINRQQ